MDPAGTVVAWSSDAERLLGHRADDVVGRHVSEVLPALSAGAGTWRRRFAGPDGTRHLDGRAGWYSLVGGRHGDGHEVPLVLEAVPLPAEQGLARWLLSAEPLAAAAAAGTPPWTAGLLKDALLERSPVAFAVWDTDLRCVWLNDTAAAQAGRAGERVAGLPFDRAADAFELSEVRPAMRRVVETGEPVIDQEIRRVRSDGVEHAFSVSMFRLDGADGRPLGVGTLGIDAAASTARRQMALLSRAGTSVGTTLDIETTAQELADVALSALADFVTVDLSDWVPLGAAPRERLRYTEFGMPAFRRAGLASIHPGAPDAVFAVGEVVYQPPSSPVVAPLLTGRSHFEPRLDTAHFWLRNDPARRRAIKHAHMHSAMIVPLKARGETLGVAVFARTDNPVSFTRDDLFFAEQLSARAALSLDNALRYSRERTAARALQQDLLPHQLPEEKGLSVACRYLPTDRHEGVGGDWYDVIPLRDGRVGLVVGDVVGHGITAAASMGRLRTAVNTLADQGLPPDRLLTGLDRVAQRLSRGTADLDRLGIPALAATCVYAAYDPFSGVCAVARAGHPPPLIITPDGEVGWAPVPAGVPIGWGLASYGSADVELPEGSVIALFTDGLVETRGDDIDTGLARLADAFRRHAGTRHDLDDLSAAVVEEMTRGAAPEDDIALLLARTRRLTT